MTDVEIKALAAGSEYDPSSDPEAVEQFQDILLAAAEIYENQ